MQEHHRMSALTGFRGLAALWVLVYHTWVYSTPKELEFTLFGEHFYGHVFISLGWSGVQVLFVLSAFLLTLPFARANAGLRPKPSIRHFLIRRIARVFPAYYAQLLLLVLVWWLALNTIAIDPQQIGAYLFMLFVPPPVGIGSPSLNGVWWTLPIELSFYLVLPLLAWLASWRLKLPLLVCAFALMLLWRFYAVVYLHGDSYTVLQLPGSMDSFGLGMLAAVLHVHFVEGKRTPILYRNSLWLLTLLTPVLFFYLGKWMVQDYQVYWSHSLILYTWTPLFSVAVVVLILNSTRHPASWLNRIFGSPVFFYLGTVSYGIYLWHPPVANWLLHLPLFTQFQGYKFPYLMMATLGLTLVLAALSWHLVEQHFIRLARRPRSADTPIPPTRAVTESQT